MEIALREINRAAIFCDKRLGVTVFAAGIVELETRAASKPDRGNGFGIERRSEFIEAMETLSAEGNQRIHGDVKDIGCLAQTWLRNRVVHSIGTCEGAGPLKTKKSGSVLCPPDGERRLTPGVLLSL